MTRVSVIKQKNYNSKELKPKLKKLLVDSGIFSLIKNQKILIKPNCTGIFKSNSGRVTHYIFLKNLIELLKNHCKSIIIGESSSIGVDTKRAFEITKIEKKLGESTSIS